MTEVSTGQGPISPSGRLARSRAARTARLQSAVRSSPPTKPNRRSRGVESARQQTIDKNVIGRAFFGVGRLIPRERRVLVVGEQGDRLAAALGARASYLDSEGIESWIGRADASEPTHEVAVLVGGVESHAGHIKTLADKGIPVLFTSEGEAARRENVTDVLIEDHFEVTRFVRRDGIRVCFAVPKHRPTQDWVPPYVERLGRRLDRQTTKREAKAAGPEVGKKFGKSWDQRDQLIAGWVPQGLSIADIGCGDMSAEKVLNPSAYLPIDRLARDERTRVVDLNGSGSEIPPDWLANVELVLLLGVLEYLREPKRLLAQLASQSKRMIISYNVFEKRSHFRQTNPDPWKSSLSDDDLRQVFATQGYDVEQRVDTGRQSIYLVKPATTSPLKASLTTDAPATLHSPRTMPRPVLPRKKEVARPLNGARSTRPDASNDPLTPEERRTLEAARQTILRTPALRKLRDQFRAFVANRDKGVQRQSFPAREELETLMRETLVKEYPALASLVEKEEAGIHQAETTIQSASPRNAALDSVKEVSGLPRVLLIGDSISIGYILQVRELLRGKANVQRIQENGRASQYGLDNLTTWLGSGKWDVIHFNFGIHDAKFISPATARVPRDQYAANLRALIDRMKVTGARLIFATTTPLPNGGVIAPSPAYDDIPARNEIALGIMRENDIAIDDLYAIALPHLANVGRANNVHFKPEGYELLARAVAESIERHLPVQIRMEPTTPEGSVDSRSGDLELPKRWTALHFQADLARQRIQEIWNGVRHRLW